MTQKIKRTFLQANLPYILRRERLGFQKELLFIDDLNGIVPQTNLKSKTVEYISNLVLKRYRIHKWTGRRKFQLSSFHVLSNYEEFFQEFSRHFKGLHRLDLTNYSFTNLPKDAFSNQLNGIGQLIEKNLSNLRQLTLEVSNFGQQHDKFFRKLRSCLLKRLLTLKHFGLTLTNDYMNNQNIDSLGCAVGKYLFNLRSLNLHFKDLKSASVDKSLLTMITDKGLQRFILKIQDRLASLSRLCLTFENCKEITGRLWANPDTQTTFPYFQNLSSFSLFLNRCRSTAEPTINAIGTTLGHYLPNLKHFELRLSPGSVTNSDLRVLGTEISKKLRKLEDLNLSFFSPCDAITDAGLEEFISLVAVRTNLKRFVLVFGSCRRVTEKGLQEMAQIVACNLPALQEFYLHFMNGFLASRQLKDHLKRIMSSIPNVSIRV